MNDMGVYLAFDVDYISMIPTGGEIVACRHSIKVDDEDLAGAYELIRKLYQEVRIERYNLKRENAKLRELVRDYDKCLDTALYLAGSAGYPCMPDSGLFSSLHPRMRELGIEAGDE